MPALLPLILGLIQAAPGAITEITALYHAVKSDLSATDQQTIDNALAAAIQNDAASTARADKALSDASQR